MKEKISLVCLQPQGTLDIPKPSGLITPRVEDLEKKKIAIIWDGKKGGDNYLAAVEELLKEKYPAAMTFQVIWGDAEASEKAKKEMDTFIFGVADNGMGGWTQCKQVITLEKLGKPGVFIIGDNAIHTTAMSSEDAGMPTVRTVVLPSIDYYPNRSTVESIKPVAEASIDSIISALTNPLTEKEKNPEVKDGSKATETIEIIAENYESAFESFNKIYLDNHWGDGLPLVPPTESAVERMLEGTMRSPDEVLGKVPCRYGIATIRKLAVNAVMAGARPEYFPVIISAMECLIDDEKFDHMLSSEGSFNLIILVSGPLANEINMNHGIGLIGHGWQANNTIGRAVRLSLINIGYLWPGGLDMALIGRSSSHTFYTFGENIEESPWETFNEGLGYKPEDSCVTVSTIMSHQSMKIYGGGVVEPWDVKSVLAYIIKDVSKNRRVLGQYKVGVGNVSAHFRKHVIVVHPELAIMLKRIGYTTKLSLRDYIYESTKVPYEELTEREKQGIEDRINTVATAQNIFFANDAIPEKQLPVVKGSLQPGGMVPVINPEDIHIIVSGSIPGYSFGMSYFRTAHRTKLIKGATLTETGR